METISDAFFSLVYFLKNFLALILGEYLESRGILIKLLLS